MVKPKTYEKWKKRSFKKDISKRENMGYDEKADTYTCHAGKSLFPLFIKKQKSKSGYESEVTVYECEDCGGWLILLDTSLDYVSLERAACVKYFRLGLKYLTQTVLSNTISGAKCPKSRKVVKDKKMASKMNVLTAKAISLTVCCCHQNK